MTSESIVKYKEQRDKLRQYFEAQKLGDQTLFMNQAKLFKPLIESQEESSKSIAEKLMTNQDVLTNAIAPLQRRIDELQFPVAIEYSTPKKDEDIDFLDGTHRENLEDMSLDLPSEVQRKGNIQETIDKIEKNNRKLGQLLRVDSKRSEREKEIFKSQQETLKIYKKSIQKFIQKSGEGLVKQKKGKGRPRKHPIRISYQDGNDLCVKLSELVAAKNAGNTSLDKTIKAVLDELLNKNFIKQCEYEQLLTRIFSH